MARVIVIAGVASGVGKTTITLALLEAYRRRGLTVRALKVGPDFIDPGFHALVTGRPSYNLDGWMCGKDHALATVALQASGADLVVVEGVMGCFDGFEGTSEDGSTAQVAKWLGAPVVLVVDARAQARSAAAVVLGFERFDPDLNVAAVVLNRVGGETHALWGREAIAAACRAVPVGAVRRDEAIVLPERHLGLVTSAEGTLTAERRDRLAAIAEAGIDLDRLLALAAPVSGAGGVGAIEGGRPCRATVGVARDSAFQFYYAENLERLRAAGAEIVFWSPLADATLPEVDGLYLGGGYPELHAATLGENAGIRKAVREFAEQGKPIYAECGGLMFLADAMEDVDGALHPMVGLLPTTVRMRPRRLTLGYTEVELAGDTPIGLAGAVARGHEFHYSTIEPVPESIARVYRLRQRRRAEGVEGYLIGRALMSYVHLHFGSNPAIARSFVDACAGGRRP